MHGYVCMMVCTCSGLVILFTLLVLSHQHSDHIELFKCTVAAAVSDLETVLFNDSKRL